jgi:hypothetical protein
MPWRASCPPPWLELIVDPEDQTRTLLGQRALFHPRRLAGGARAVMISPLHGLVLGAMLASVARAAQGLGVDPAAPPRVPAPQLVDAPDHDGNARMNSTCHSSGVAAANTGCSQGTLTRAAAKTISQATPHGSSRLVTTPTARSDACWVRPAMAAPI